MSAPTTCAVCFDECFDKSNCCTQLCWTCYLKLNSLCPICDRTEINKQIECEYCEKDMSMYDYYYNHWCDICHEDFFYEEGGCEDCLARIHNHEFSHKSEP